MAEKSPVVNDLDGFQIDKRIFAIPPEAKNSSNATIIRGNSKWKTCWRHACYLSKYVYKEPPSPDGFHTQFPEKMAEIEENWEKWDELVEQENSGLVARLFKVKGYDPSSKTDACPPILVYRGTDFEDMRNIAVAITLRWRWAPFFGTYEKILVLDKQLNPNSTREQLINAGFESIPIYTEEDSIQAESAADGVYGTIDIALTLEILAKEDGDWANNIQQGLGRGSTQYKSAIIYGRRIVEEKILPSAEARLELTGHSLGGGLASAVCAVLDREFPQAYFHSIVFNPSGVHPNTIKPASDADGLIDGFAVEDDILTTLQSYRGNLPVVGAIFRLAKRTINQDGLPEPLCTFLPKKGISPGKTKETWAIPPKGEKLPNLFPINEQTLIPPPRPEGFPELTRLDEMFNASPSVSFFATAFLAYINERYRPVANEAVQRWWGKPVHWLYTDMFKRYMADLKPEFDSLSQIVLAAIDYHGMDYVIATYETHYGRL